MQAGFGFLEAGFVRSKNVVNIMAENLMDTTMTTIGFILLGFGLMFGAGNAFIGTEWVALQGIPDVMPGLSAITFYGVGLMERIKIDDPVGAFPVHGLNGIFGVLAVAIWGTKGLGILHGGSISQLGIQAVGIVACIAWTLPLALLMFYLIKKTIGLRIAPEVEASGIDMPYHGIESYPEWDSSEEIATPPNKEPIPSPGD